jgi:hypothetical protein
MLESGVAAYPYSGAMVATLALQYFNNGKTLKASIVIHQFRKVFPEDARVANALKQIEGVGNSGDFSGAPGRNTTTVLPR